MCDYCGSIWYRSQLYKDGAGMLVCPDEGEGLDAVTLNELNAQGVRGEDQWRGLQPQDVGQYAVPEPPMPLVLSSELQLHLTGDTGVTTDEEGRLVEVVDLVRGRTFAPQVSTLGGPLWAGQSINGRQALGLFDTQGIAHAVGIPLEHTTHTVFFAVDALDVDSLSRVLMRLENTGPAGTLVSFWQFNSTEMNAQIFLPAFEGVTFGAPSAGQRVIAVECVAADTAWHYDEETFSGPLPGRYVPAETSIVYGGQDAASLRPFGGKIGEVLHFSPVMAENERVAMVEWLERKWGFI